MPLVSRLRTRRPATKRWSSADFDVVLAQVTPAVLALLGNRLPRTTSAVEQG
jgi:hypothetical protein